ncbi:MAG: class I mannose-6-phosphate isomerase [Verrucomicrobia bacterium]|nr:class I mannose-6-phosphate isomerase [Verrucomicrobiota bacterium]
MDHRGKLLLLPPNRVWRTYPGGRTLDELAGTPAPADTHLAEDWIASTTVAKNPPEAFRPPDAQLSSPPGVSQVRVGHDATPRDFVQLLASDPEYFLGAAHVAKYGAQPQVLVKYLDSGTRLHFQVHPTREFARRILGAPSGKTEAYHVLSVRDSSSTGGEATGYIYVGFQRPPAPAQLREWIATQNLAAIEACFDQIPVRAGDTFIIPGGTPHALGAGVFMVEIQEPSDLVVRFEFERAGYVLPESSRFMDRGLDFALTVFNYAPLTADDLAVRVRCAPRRLRALGPSSYQDELIGANQTDCFRVLKSSLDGPVVKDETSVVIAIVTAGSVTAEVGGEVHRLRAYDKFFLPAGLGPVSYTPAPGGCALLECLPPAP